MIPKAQFGSIFPCRLNRLYCDATSQIGLLCTAPFYGIRPHQLNFGQMVVNMTLANNAIAGRDQRIADLAYRIWEEDGRPEGRAEAHWLRAVVLVDELPPRRSEP